MPGAQYFPESLLEVLRQGTCVAVVGAGLSMPDYPGWQSLLDEMHEACNVGRLGDGSPSLGFAHLRGQAQEKFWPALSKVLGDRRLKPRVKARYNSLVATNFRGFATTNIDEQIRAAFSRVGRPLEFVISWADESNSISEERPSLIASLLTNKRDWIFQLHGERFHPDDCILGEDDYTKVWGSSHGTQSRHLVGLDFMKRLASHSACFIGFSFTDERMYGHTELRKERRNTNDSAPWFAIVPEPASDAINITLKELYITRVSFPNTDGEYYELDNLLRRLSYMTRANSLRGTEEAALRGAGYIMQEGQTDDPGLVQQFRAGTRVKFAGIDLKCKIFPSEFWEEDWYGQKRHEAIFLDEGEAPNQLRIQKAQAPPPVSQEQLLREVEQLAEDTSAAEEQKKEAKSVLARLKLGQNAYPRLAGPVKVEEKGNIRTLQITVADSTYGLTLVAEKNLPIPSLGKLLNLNLNSLAVRIAYTYSSGGRRYCLCQQRRKEANATYEEAWDVAAAGYIDPSRHEQLGQLSPWLAAARELEEEPRIRREYLPYADNYEFFGVVRNEDSGQLDILGECKGSFVTDWANHEHGQTVECLEACELTPAAVADFVCQKRWWVPTAILTLLLVLEADFTRPQIEQALLEAEVRERVYLEKHRKRASD